MIHQVIEIKVHGSLPGARLVTYVQEYSKELGTNERPLILLCPVGAYYDTSYREA